MTYFLNYLKYKNKYLMQKKMIGGNYESYFATYLPTKLEKIDYDKIKNGFMIETMDRSYTFVN